MIWSSFWIYIVESRSRCIHTADWQCKFTRRQPHTSLMSHCLSACSTSLPAPPSSSPTRSSGPTWLLSKAAAAPPLPPPLHLLLLFLPLLRHHRRRRSLARSRSASPAASPLALHSSTCAPRTPTNSTTTTITRRLHALTPNPSLPCITPSLGPRSPVRRFRPR